MPDVANDQLHSISKTMFHRSWITRRPRFGRNSENWLAYRGEQDFRHKQPWQSQETTPNFPIAVDQIVGSFERALTDSDDWLVADPPGVGETVLEPDMIRRLLLFYLTHLWIPGNKPDSTHGIQVLVSDATKMGIMEPEVVVKVIPVLKKQKHYRFETTESKDEQGDVRPVEYAGKKLTTIETEVFRLHLELIPWEDYYPDPSPAKSYAIHRTRRRLHELLANPEYDQAVLKAAIGSAREQDIQLRKRLSQGERANPDQNPYEVEVFECWGDIIDETSGEILATNQYWTYIEAGIIRKASDNPFWDGTRPFITASLTRVPGSNEPSALADRSVPMWRAANELINLYIDGAFRATWGVGQIRPDMMEAPEEVADGMPQGYTAVLKPNAPLGAKFYERVDSGEIPNQALDPITRIEGKVNEGLAMPDTRVGQLPERRTKATELVQAMRASGSLYESFAARFEDTFLEPLFEKCWRAVLQYADEFDNDELVKILGPDTALTLLDLSQEERFKLMAQTHFKVRGLRGIASQERQFTKLTTLLSILTSNEQFADHFGQNFDFTKLWNALIRSTGLDPDLLRLDKDPAQAAQDGAGDALTEATAGLQGLATERAAVAGGQLDPALGASSGASLPNMSNAEGRRGEQSAFAPNNPNASGGATG